MFQQVAARLMGMKLGESFVSSVDVSVCRPISQLVSEVREGAFRAIIGLSCRVKSTSIKRLSACWE